MKEFLAYCTNGYLTDAMSDAYDILSESITPQVTDLRRRIKSFDGNFNLGVDIFDEIPDFCEAARSYNEQPESLFARMIDNPDTLGYLVDAYYTDDDEIDSYAISDGDLPSIMHLLNKHPDIIKKYNDYAHNVTGQTSECFSYNHTKINEWLVHNTSEENVGGILNNGFLYGASRNHLGWTGSGNKDDECGEYGFAFPIRQAPDPNYRGEMKYGTNSIVFIGTGVNAYHYGDEEDQVMFDLATPTSCFLVCRYELEDSLATKNALENWKEDNPGKTISGLEYNQDIYTTDYFWCVVGEKNGRETILFKSRDDDSGYQNCLAWIERNGKSYEPYMFHFKNRGHNRASESIMKRRA